MKRKEFLEDIRKLDEEKLLLKARDIAEELMKLRCRHVSGQVTQTHRFTVLKRELARLNTVLTQSKVQAAKA